MEGSGGWGVRAGAWRTLRPPLLAPVGPPRGPRRAAKSAWALQQRQRSSRAAVQGPTISRGQGFAQEQGWGGSEPQPRLEAAKRAPARTLDFPGASTPVSDPILTTASLAGALGPASGRRNRGGDGQWLSGAQHRPVGGWGLEPEPVGRRRAPSKAGRNAGRGRGLPPPPQMLAPRPPASHLSHGPPSRHHPPLCRRLWVLLKNRNSLRSNHSSGPACSVYELRQVTQPLWASTSSFVKWGDAPAPLVGLP